MRLLIPLCLGTEPLLNHPNPEHARSPTIPDKRFQGAVAGIAEDLIEAAFFAFAGEEGDAEILGLLNLGSDAAEHGEGAGEVKSAHADRATASAQSSTGRRSPG